MKQLPEYWYVLYKNEDEFNEINEYYCKGWAYIKLTDNNKYGYVNIYDDNNWYSSRTAIKKYKNYDLTEISFEKWQILVCGKAQTSPKFNLNKLLHILKFINNYGNTTNKT